MSVSMFLYLYCDHFRTFFFFRTFFKAAEIHFKGNSFPIVIVCKLDENRETLLQGAPRTPPAWWLSLCSQGRLKKPKGFKVETKNNCSM